MVNRGKSALKNRIWMICGAALLVVLSLWGIRGAFSSAVALEQEARCGAQEHIHTAECYVQGDLRCGKMAHTHNRNCYLVLLKDNDINSILTHLDGADDHSLETLIHRTVGTALTYNRNLVVLGTQSGTSAGQLLSSGQTESSGTSIQSVDLAAMNETISENDIQPGIVLNENLYSASPLSGTTGQVTNTTTQNTGNTGASTLSLGASPIDSSGNANFYVYLDGNWQCIGTLTFSVVKSNDTYTARLGTANVVSLINTSLGLNLTYQSFEVVYTTSASTPLENGASGSVGSTYVTLGENYGRQSTARQAKYVYVVDGNGDPLEFYTVTYEYPDGSTDQEYVKKGDTVTLPDGYTWTSDDNGEYVGGSDVAISKATVFTAGTGAGTSGIRIVYDVNFPTAAGTFSNTVYMPDSPTLAGTAVTTLTDAVEENAGAVVRDVSAREVAARTDHQGGFYYLFYFSGWQTETGELISPNNGLRWEELQLYDEDGNGRVELEGQWLHSKATTANFCVRYDSKTGQSDTSTSKYTPSIFTTYVGGDGTLSLNGTTDEEAYEVDKQIRALYGNWSGELWLYSFPSDEYVFEQLKNYTSKLTVEDEEVSADDLNSSQYAIRWYMIKEDGADGWHIDGRLIRKKGQITVDKEFFGAEDTIHAAENGFYIVAVNGTRAADGTFTPYASSNTHFKQYVLVLDEATKTSLTGTYPNATFHIYDSAAEFSDGEGYEWMIEDVELGEYWQITEYAVDVSGNMYYAEYSVYDTDGNTTAIAEYGTKASVLGKTFALDEDPDQGLLVDFRNYYYPTESILIKKEDADTGQPIGNAVFEIWQYNSEGQLVQLKFSYDSQTKQYRYDNNGTVTRITTGDEGFTTVTTTGFSYSHGAVVVKEVISPTGYAAAPNITLTESGGTVSITAMAYENGTVMEQSRWADYAEVYQDGSTLIVKNHSTALTSVTANKVWADGVSAESVTLVLQANDTTATNLFPGLPNVRATLNAANNWTYTWSDLPTYANGEPVTWSVKEILVGSETTTSDGVSFANWTVVYSQPTRTDTDYDGVTDHWSYTVTNSVRRAQLYLVKTDPSGNALAGAVFELVEVNAAGSPVPGAVTVTGTTDSSGQILFDNLKYTTRYRLTETSPPNGYIAFTSPAYLTLAADGTVTVEGNSQVSGGTQSYVVYVLNYSPNPLPSTGGSGSGIFATIGTALMLFAVCGYILPRHRKRGGYGAET